MNGVSNACVCVDKLADLAYSISIFMLLKWFEGLKKNRGFTLVELLVVLLILGVLIALAVPKYIQAQGRAKETTFCSNVRSIISALETYKMDHESMEYPATESLDLELLQTDKYFSQKPINPYTGKVIKNGDNGDGTNGKFEYTRSHTDPTRYTITTTPSCDLTAIDGGT